MCRGNRETVTRRYHSANLHEPGSLKFDYFNIFLPRKSCELYSTFFNTDGLTFSSSALRIIRKSQLLGKIQIRCKLFSLLSTDIVLIIIINCYILDIALSDMALIF